MCLLMFFDVLMLKCSHTRFPNVSFQSLHCITEVQVLLAHFYLTYF